MDVVIVGAGVAGLHCARLLEQAGLNVLLLEAADIPGGRIRTDLVEGFRLDRGFQVLLTAYPEAKRALNYPALQLCSMKPGALVYKNERMHYFADPFRDPGAALKLVFDPIVSLRDKLLVARLRGKVQQGPWESLFSNPETSTLEYLRSYGFSSAMIECFFRPFFSGVFLERDLATSSRYFEFLFRIFAQGLVAVPEQGMGVIPRQMAENLKPRTLQTQARVHRIAPVLNGITVEADGVGSIMARAVVLAAGQPSESFGLPAAAAAPAVWNRTTTFYFAAEHAPVQEPILVLNGNMRDGQPATGPLNHLAVMSRVSPQYAPPGAELIAANVVGTAPQDPQELNRLAEQVREQCRQWFGDTVREWKLIASYPIARALPLSPHVEWNPAPDASRLSSGVYACGDDHLFPGVQGALISARTTAECILRDLGAISTK
ncbi:MULTISPECIES: NAD(P)/FAD-dependent oxidoreductase [Acidobacterium]|uniref:FAD dependent oxidoreductase n=1 Tax=Acidobacterium capsulatum (strain ATCC 51196 / DSM 11244 / BCRC 80197 / JCM 7670 / NBRC 15755 / NCIMB 13165 / 161) TaxID=240015 RepID=C1F9W2_ACIC5|nr:MULTISPECIES: NAD(P)/FAD-dependent oxidoreductase [Acidobacterium]ACO32471.1 FAD dependent oxidoreductase [Acidobacterium capsulatum ATCC 51196]HCT61705.1 FAD-dependent oxidoreductase [Acidobacterium sp.]